MIELTKNDGIKVMVNFSFVNYFEERNNYSDNGKSTFISFNSDDYLLVKESYEYIIEALGK